MAARKRKTGTLEESTLHLAIEHAISRKNFNAAKAYVDEMAKWETEDILECVTYLCGSLIWKMQ